MTMRTAKGSLFWKKIWLEIDEGFSNRQLRLGEIDCFGSAYNLLKRFLVFCVEYGRVHGAGHAWLEVLP